jgi:hypothetical protein
MFNIWTWVCRLRYRSEIAVGIECTGRDSVLAAFLAGHPQDIIMVPVMYKFRDSVLDSALEVFQDFVDVSLV